MPKAIAVGVFRSAQVHRQFSLAEASSDADVENRIVT